MPAHRHAEIAPEVREICERYGVPYNTGPLPKQFATVVRKIVKLALPSGVCAEFRAPDSVTRSPLRSDSIAVPQRRHGSPGPAVDPQLLAAPGVARGGAIDRERFSHSMSRARCTIRSGSFTSLDRRGRQVPE